jgi:predicted dinucleotide-binding enzyme
MDVTIIGAGTMARGIGTRLIAGGCHLQILNRHPDAAEALAADLSSAASMSAASAMGSSAASMGSSAAGRSKGSKGSKGSAGSMGSSGGMGQPEAGPGSATAGELGTHPVLGEVVILAVPYPGVPEVATLVGDQLQGRIVVDITNPVDFSTFDRMVTPPTSSGAEEIARLLPGARMIKAFNTTFAGTLLTGTVGGMALDVFLASDDPGAIKTLCTLIEQGGMRPVEVGPLRRAHELEAMGFLHMLVQEPMNTQMTSALKIIS